jgi:hypothetical protein
MLLSQSHLSHDSVLNICDRLISNAAKIKTGNEAAWKKLQTIRSQRELKV